MTKAADEPAFPLVKRFDELQRLDTGRIANTGKSLEGGTIHEGLSKRELLAALAMQGLLANPNCLNGKHHRSHLLAAVGETARLYADALLAELQKE